MVAWLGIPILCANYIKIYVFAINVDNVTSAKERETLPQSIITQESWQNKVY